MLIEKNQSVVSRLIELGVILGLGIVIYIWWPDFISWWYEVKITPEASQILINVGGEPVLKTLLQGIAGALIYGIVIWQLLKVKNFSTFRKWRVIATIGLLVCSVFSQQLRLDQVASFPYATEEQVINGGAFISVPEGANRAAEEWTLWYYMGAMGASTFGLLILFGIPGFILGTQAWEFTFITWLGWAVLQRNDISHLAAFGLLVCAAEIWVATDQVEPDYGAEVSCVRKFIVGAYLFVSTLIMFWVTLVNFFILIWP